MSTQVITSERVVTGHSEAQAATLLARLERLPITRRLLAIRVVVGLSTFFDAYTIIAIAFALPQLTQEWGLTPTFVGLIIAASYVGQLCGALFFGSLAEKIGRIGVLRITIIMFVVMDAACLFAWNGWSILVIRFLQGLGIGAEVPVASAYINEFVGAKKRGRFFLLYEVIFPIGMMFAGLVGYFLVPLYGWKVMFLIGLIPSALTVPLRWLMPESPRWLTSKGRQQEAEKVVATFEAEAVRRGMTLAEPIIKPIIAQSASAGGVKELFSEMYKPRTFMLWGLWLTVYTVNNGMITWFPTLYKTWFHLPLETSLAYGWLTSSCGVVASVICALLIDKVGRKRWYTWAFMLAIIPLITLCTLGAKSAVEILILGSMTYAILQTVAFSLYLYSAELYPTRLRAIGTAFSSAWLRAGSSIGPLLVGFIMSGFGVRFVFIAFAVIALIGGLVTWLFAVETKGKSLEELSP
ncbi:MULTISPECIES: MFS transporter [Klebsiella pneumoniae complex]|uniref:MFS transporter n=1 Tax=Klebsiella pneumoniae complex TaxID=3390273 RepID=UPI000893306A|nr:MULTISPECIES: MFS transporter [Klebsiella]AUU87612.1 MFS transporter [Enterobacteriaceae bacterium ENNIH3]AUV07093.1 MFS transporter [Enterobacteriaceae bacterium ENNIH2]PWF53738.1 MFS transporter [[Kluyvera] intestini]MCC4960118.1 MFS transporter [Klebsiella pneumoniae]MCD7091348.1 MFS transporter [Klebsiella quasipneumoniae subsp. quasipneumoniae]